MRRYHDEEWGVPTHDDRKLFEFLALEAAQAGLSWRTILHKREAFVRAFDGFDPERVAGFGDADIERMLQDAGIVRNRLKLQAIVHNAQRFVEVQREFGSFAAYLWVSRAFAKRTTAAEESCTTGVMTEGRMGGGVGLFGS